MTAAEVLIKIRTLFERKGASEATDALRQTGQQAEQTGRQIAKLYYTGQQQFQETGKEAKNAGQQGADGMNVMGAAAAAVNGNVTGVATALVPLITKVKALGAAISTVSLVMAALTVAYTVFTKIAEYATKAAEAVADFNAKSRADMIEAVTKAYDRQAIAMDRISKLRDAELERTKAINDANKEFELASTRQAKLTELKGTTDESKRSEIEDKYTRIEQKISGKYDSANDTAEYERMKKSEEENWQKSESIARQILQKKAILRRTANSAGEAEKASEDLNDNNAWGQNSGQIEAKKKEAEKSRADAEKLQEDIEKLEQNRVNLADEAKRIKGLRPAAQRRMEASALERQNATATLDIKDSDRQRTNQESLYSAFENLQVTSARLDPSDQQALGEELNRLDKAGNLTVEAIVRMTQNLERIVKAYDAQEARMRNIQ